MAMAAAVAVVVTVVAAVGEGAVGMAAVVDAVAPRSVCAAVEAEVARGAVAARVAVAARAAAVTAAVTPMAAMPTAEVATMAMRRSVRSAPSTTGSSHAPCGRCGPWCNLAFARERDVIEVASSGHKPPLAHGSTPCLPSPARRPRRHLTRRRARARTHETCEARGAWTSHPTRRRQPASHRTRPTPHPNCAGTRDLSPQRAPSPMPPRQEERMHPL